MKTKAQINEEIKTKRVYIQKLKDENERKIAQINLDKVNRDLKLEEDRASHINELIKKEESYGGKV
jgi:hypothetical protein